MGYAVLRHGPKSVATKYHEWISLEPGTRCKSYQPDSLDDEQFNTIIEVPGKGVFMVQSIDFDFLTEYELNRLIDEEHDRLCIELDKLYEEFFEKAGDLAYKYGREAEVIDAIDIITDVLVEKGWTIISNEVLDAQV